LRLALKRADLSVREEADKWIIDHSALCEATVGRYHAALRRLADLKPDEYYDPRESEAQIRLWMGEFNRAAKLSRQVLAKRAKSEQAKDAGNVQQDWTITLAEAELHLGRFSAATSALETMLREARSMAWAEQELYSMRCLADAHRLHADYASARALLDDLDEIPPDPGRPGQQPPPAARRPPSRAPNPRRRGVPPGVVRRPTLRLPPGAGTRHQHPPRPWHPDTQAGQLRQTPPPPRVRSFSLGVREWRIALTIKRQDSAGPGAILRRGRSGGFDKGRRPVRWFADRAGLRLSALAR
jgi:tetratricopeptide (TPR) repeat protein